MGKLFDIVCISVDPSLSFQNTAAVLKFANTDTNFLFIIVRLGKGKQNRQCSTYNIFSKEGKIKPIPRSKTNTYFSW